MSVNRRFRRADLIVSPTGMAIAFVVLLVVVLLIIAAAS